MKSRMALIFLWLCCLGVWVVWLIKKSSNSEVLVSVVDHEVDKAGCDSILTQNGDSEHKKQDVRQSRINVNSGNVAELILLPGIGKTIAQDIIDYRVEKGPFKNIEDLGKVRGLGPSKLRKLNELICF